METSGPSSHWVNVYELMPFWHQTDEITEDYQNKKQKAGFQACRKAKKTK